MTKHWGQIITIWLIVAALAIWAIVSQSESTATSWFGTILASSVALVSLYHLFRARPEGIVRKLVYVGGGSYLILALATGYLLFVS
jgi:multisubunit Na+/H+ antiporter MnhE subunit